MYVMALWPLPRSNFTVSMLKSDYRTTNNLQIDVATKKMCNTPNFVQI
uniref:Uncharacterized protein n=1 Tax=Ciona intestinalis TaxID=7719 RepID=H2Y105_CIOIN